MSDSDVFSVRGEQKRHPSREVGLARLAGKQFGVISLKQMRALGFTYAEVRGRVDRGQLHPLHAGVYAVGHRNLVPHARLIAALLAGGPASFLSHRTAAAIWGLRLVNTRHIEITLVSGGTRGQSGLKVHRTAPPDPADIRVRNGLRVSSVPRMLIEAAAHEKRSELDRLITQAVRKRILDLAAIEAALARHARKPGIDKLKAALRDYRPRQDRKSDLESAFDRLIAGTDVPPPQRNVVIGGWELDCYWPEARFALELDGRPYHTAVRDMEKDKLKDAKLLRMGIQSMRVTDLRFELEPQAVLADVRAILAGAREARARRAG